MSATATKTATATDDTVNPLFTPFLAEMAPDAELGRLNVPYQVAAARRADLRERLATARTRRAEIDRDLLDADAAKRTKLLGERTIIGAELDALPGQLRAAGETHCLAHLAWLRRLAQLARAAAQAVQDDLTPLSNESMRFKRRLDLSIASDDDATMRARVNELAREAQPIVARRDAAQRVVDFAQCHASRYGEVRLIPSGTYGGDSWEMAARRAGEHEAVAARRG